MLSADPPPPSPIQFYPRPDVSAICPHCDGELARWRETPDAAEMRSMRAQVRNLADEHAVAVARSASLQREVAILRRAVKRRDNLLREGIEAFRVTREYVGRNERGTQMLPALPGWSWFDWCGQVEALLNEDDDG